MEDIKYIHLKLQMDRLSLKKKLPWITELNTSQIDAESIYSMKQALDDVDDESKHLLEEYINDYEDLINTTYYHLADICKNEDIKALHDICAEYNWVNSIIKSYAQELGNIIIKTGNIEMIEYLHTKNLNLSNYLETAIENKQYIIAKWLLKNNADPLPLLEKNKYTREEIDILTEHLESGNLYKGISLYNDREFEKALHLFQTVNDDSRAKLYEGLCLQYLYREDEAKACFATVLGKYENIAQDHIKALESKDQVSKLIKDQAIILMNMDNILLGEYQSLYTEINEFSNIFQASDLYETIDEKLKSIKQQIDTISYCEFRKSVSDHVLLAYEFHDMESIYTHYIKKMTDHDKIMFNEFKDAKRVLYDMKYLLNKCTKGFLIEKLI